MNFLKKIVHEMCGQQQTKITFEDDLRISISEGRNDEVKSIIKDLQSLDITDDSGTTLLHLAAKKGNKDLVKFMIDSGCDINIKNCFGTTPLLTSVLYNRFDVVGLLLESNAEIDVTNANGKSALDVVLNVKRKFPINLVKCFYESLKRNGLSSEAIGEKFVKAGCSLVTAIHMYDADLTRVILEGQKSIDVRVSRDITKVAMETNNLENLRVLLQYGPDVTERRETFRFELARSLKYSYRGLDFTRPLVEKLICWNLIDEEFIVILRDIFMNASKEAIELLLENKIDVHVNDKFGKDLFCNLCGNSKPGIVELLRLRKIDLNANVLHLAIENKAIEIVHYLLDEGADPNILSMSGNTPLHIACYGEVESVELLLQYGADILAVDADDRTIFERFRFSLHYKTLLPVLAHLALLEARGVSIKQKIRDAIDFREKSKNLYHSLRLQIEETKKHKIFRYFTLFDILARRPENIADCIRNRSVLSSILTCCEDEQWQNSYYVSRIKLHVSRALEIIDLRKKAILAVYDCSGHLFSSDHLALEMIVSFLNYKDLRVFA